MGEYNQVQEPQHSETYKCSVCEGLFCKPTHDWSDEHAKVQYEIVMGDAYNEDSTSIVCDICYTKIQKWARDSGLKYDKRVI